MDALALLCPACGGALTRAHAELACAACARRFARHADLLDLRLEPGHAFAPAPLAAGDLAPAEGARAAQVPFRDGLEALLLSLSDEKADRLMQVLRESRGAWFPLLGEGTRTLLFLGSALSGTVTPLAAAGFQVTVLERSGERARFARYRNEHHSPGAIEIVLGGDAPRLPFADRAFDVVVQEEGLFAVQPAFAHALAECRRVCARELVVVADNRLAYKRSSGRRSDFRTPGPLEFARLALRNERGERTLAGYRRLLERAGFARTRAFALYPHAHDFTHVVALDARLPALTIGPKERKNRIKLAARALGLFPLLTPSFALLAARRADSPATRVERMLAELAERVGEPQPVLEQLVGTRGNTAILHTSLPGADAGQPTGRWTLHLPLAPKNVPQVERHYTTLELLRARFPRLPVPEPLAHGRFGGFWQSCERRASGWTAPQLSGDRPRIARMLRESAAHFADLIVRPAAPFTADDFEREVGARFALVARHAAVPSTIANLARLRDAARERLLGRSIARVLFHSDLRAKHVQVDADGHVVAFLDWGTTELEGLPYFDLLHLVTHERKQEAALSAAQAWHIVRDRVALRDEEREALDGYARAVGLDDETARTFEAIYPVFVAAMAEKHWDYSRPRWLHKQFGL